MITYLRIAVDHEEGEAWFTKGSIAELKEWQESSDVFAADITKDIMFGAENLYAEAMEQWRKNAEGKIGNAS